MSGAADAQRLDLLTVKVANRSKSTVNGGKPRNVTTMLSNKLGIARSCHAENLRPQSSTEKTVSIVSFTTCRAVIIQPR